MKYIASFLLAFFPAIALAVGNCNNSIGALCNPLRASTVQEFLTILLGLIVQIGFPIIVLFIVFVGFRFVQHSASGNAEELKKDREYFLWAVIGALILLGAQAISLAISATVDQISNGVI